MFEAAALSGYAGALAFAVLSALLLAADRGHRVGRLLIAAAALSTLWLALGAAYYGGHRVGVEISGLSYLELLRDLAWFAFLAAVMLSSDEPRFRRRVKRIVAVAVVAIALAALLSFASQSLITLPGVLSDPAMLRKSGALCFLSIAILGLVIIEQLVRATRADARWAIKHLSLGIGAIFAFDFYLYADALLFNRIDANVWAARGIVNAFTVPLITLAAARNRDWNLEIFVSRRVVFHSAVALGAGLYLLLVSLAGYYLNSYGGTWGGALRAAFVSGALLFLVTLMFSSQVRSRLRMFLAKHFYKNRYEYGEVWLSFTRKLSTSEADPDQLRATILRAIADIVDSTGGVMWSKTENGQFIVDSSWSMDGEPGWQLEGDHAFIRALEASQDLFELRNADLSESSIDFGFPWLDQLRRAWIAVPIAHGDELLAFLILAEPRTNEAITFEDRDLLRTVGRQAASYLAFLRATEALAEARQFEAFNRLSAFLVHDLKNVVAQLSLIVRNAERHRDNPEFISDAFNTIGDAVAKINRMLASLRQESAAANEKVENIELNGLITHAVKQCSERAPRPEFQRHAEALEISASHDRLLSVVEHLVQNAQDATTDDGSVVVTLEHEAENAVIRISDTGCGMDEEFVRTRLFRPFDTTKGKAGMGIGVYESRHIVSNLGGRLDVTSEPGVGTAIVIRLPLSNPSVPAAGLAGAPESNA
ncbi:MAG: XrtA/PEP-CTERM system histidine kinase PrsK [Gammaproteobacteria bacterium]|jgi:putative PEP-CTERM system histidine kinase